MTPPNFIWKGHALWLVGFRPFFLLACLAGVALPLLWAAVLSGALPPPRAPTSVVQWHAHEMFFGFGLAVLGGFLLTATKNWVKVRGYYGRWLQLLAAAWCLERLGMWFGAAWPRPLFLISNHLFLGALVAMLAWTLLRHRAQDTYRDNFLFLVALPAFAVARVLLLSPEGYLAGRAMALALFRLAFIVMLERTLEQFMKAAFKVSVPRVAAVDAAVKGLGLALVGAPFLPPAVGALAALALGVLFAGRLALWSPHLALRRVDIGVMFVGGFALAAQLALEALAVFAPVAWVGAVTVHVFTFGVMGLVIPAMITRISRGHTGRPVAFGLADKAALWVMMLGFAVRVVAPQLNPGAYRAWTWGAAACWAAAFAVVGARAAPLLLGPRVDGREH